MIQYCIESYYLMILILRAVVAQCCPPKTTNKPTVNQTINLFQSWTNCIDKELRSGCVPLTMKAFFLIVQIETTNLATTRSSVKHLRNKRQSYWNQFLGSNGSHCHLLDCKKCSREEEKSRNSKAMPAAKWSLSVELPVLIPFRALQRKLRVFTECAECSWRVQCRYLKIRTLSFPWEDLGKNLNRALWCKSLSVGSFNRDNTFQTQENIFRFIIHP